MFRHVILTAVVILLMLLPGRVLTKGEGLAKMTISGPGLIETVVLSPTQAKALGADNLWRALDNLVFVPRHVGCGGYVLTLYYGRRARDRWAYYSDYTGKPGYLLYMGDVSATGGATPRPYLGLWYGAWPFNEAAFWTMLRMHGLQLRKCNSKYAS